MTLSLALSLLVASQASAQAPSGRSPAIVGGIELAETPAASETRKVGCPVPSMDGARISGRFLSWKKDVFWSTGQKMAEYDSDLRGSPEVTVKGLQGELIARGLHTETSAGYEMTVTDCNGDVVGKIVEMDLRWWGDRSYFVRDAEDRFVGSTGRVTRRDSEFVLMDSKGHPIAKVSEDNSELNVIGAADHRLVLMMTIMNDHADYRSRDRDREHRGGRDR